MPDNETVKTNISLSQHSVNIACRIIQCRTRKLLLYFEKDVERSGPWDVFYLPWIEAHKFSRNLANHLKILGARKLTRNKFHTEDPQILEATIKKNRSTR